MKTIIAGSGELGRLLAAALCEAGHNVVLLDAQSNRFRNITDRYDIQTLEGSCVNVSHLKNAGIADADALIAVTGDEPSNILACRIASLFGVKKTVCRLYESDCFSQSDGITAEQFGIWKAFSAPDESAKKVLDVLSRDDVLEQIRFANADALMTVFQISESSPLQGVQVKDIPCKDILSKIRLAALVRDKKFMPLNGTTTLISGDKVYVSGRSENVENFISRNSQENSRSREIVIAGTGDTAFCLLELIARDYPGYHVRMIGSDERKNNRFLSRVSHRNLSMFYGDITDPDVQREAGVPGADVFVSLDDDDENSILSCIVADRLGAGKVVSVTHKPEYGPIASALDQIDCGFNMTLASLNTVLRLLDGGVMHVDTELQQCDARLTEFKVDAGAEIEGKRIAKAGLPSSAVLALVLRGNEVIAPDGDMILTRGDTVVSIVTPGGCRMLKKMFSR